MGRNLRKSGRIVMICSVKKGIGAIIAKHRTVVRACSNAKYFAVITQLSIGHGTGKQKPQLRWAKHITSVKGLTLL